MRKSNLALYGKPAQENLDEQQGQVVAGEAAAAGASPDAAAVVVDPEPEATVVPELEPGTDGLEAALLMIQEDVIKAEDNEIAITNTEQVVEQLEVATERLLPTIIQNGGLDRNGAAVLSWALESLYQTAGLGGASNGISAESFGRTMSQIDATTWSMEEAEAKTQDIKSKLLELWEKAMEHLAQLWNKFFDGATKMRERALKTAAYAKGVKGAAKSKAMPAVGADKLTIAQRVEPKIIVAALGDLANDLAKFMKESGEVAKKILEELSKGKTDVLQYAIPAGFSQVDPAKVGMPQPADGLAIYATGKEVPGGKQLAILAPAEPKSATPEMLAKTAARMADYNSGVSAPENMQMTILAPADLERLLNDVAKIADICLSYKPLQSALDTQRKQVMAKAKELIAGGKANEALTDMAKGCMAVLTQFGPIIASYLLNTGGAAIQMIEAQLKQYGESKPDAAKPTEKPADKPAAEPAPAKEPAAQEPPAAPPAEEPKAA